MRPGGGLEGATELRGPWGTFHSSWESEPWLCEMGPWDQVDFMSESLPSHRERMKRQNRSEDKVTDEYAELEIRCNCIFVQDWKMWHHMRGSVQKPLI